FASLGFGGRATPAQKTLVVQKLRQKHSLEILLSIAQLPRATFYYHLIPKPVKKLEKLFIAPKVRQVLYGTSQRALARCACAQRTGFLIKFFNQESV
ncbi:MAG: hypothetical protein U0M99_00475, partial [Oscillospiraceae bacterium]